MSFIICNDAPGGNYFTPERVAEAGMASGYHFSVLSCTTNGEETHITVSNTGVAPIYRDAYISVAGKRAAKSLRGLLPGEKKTYSISAKATTDNVRIESDFILPSQQIEFEAK